MGRALAFFSGGQVFSLFGYAVRFTTDWSVFNFTLRVVFLPFLPGLQVPFWSASTGNRWPGVWRPRRNADQKLVSPVPAPIVYGPNPKQGLTIASAEVQMSCRDANENKCW